MFSVPGVDVQMRATRRFFPRYHARRVPFHLRQPTRSHSRRNTHEEEHEARPSPVDRNAQLAVVSGGWRSGDLLIMGGCFPTEPLPEPYPLPSPFPIPTW